MDPGRQGQVQLYYSAPRSAKWCATQHTYTASRLFTHSHTRWQSCHAADLTHQGQLGVQCFAQGHFNMNYLATCCASNLTSYAPNQPITHVYMWCWFVQTSRGVAKAWKDPRFGRSFGPILLDGVQCTGNELSLAECPQNKWEQHNCEDAGVSCNPYTGQSQQKEYIPTHNVQFQHTAVITVVRINK